MILVFDCLDQDRSEVTHDFFAAAKPAGDQIHESRLQSPTDVLVQLPVADERQDFIQPPVGHGRNGKGKSLVDGVAKQLE